MSKIHWICFDEYSIELEIFLSFVAIGFVTWYGTGLDDLLFMSVVFKEKTRQQKTVMFFGNLAAVVVIVLLASYLANLSQHIKNYPMAFKLPGLIPITIGFLEIRALVQKRRRKKLKKTLLCMENIKGYNLFMFAFFLYVFNSIDDFVVTSSIFIANNETIKIFSYGTGFVCGSAVSLYLASKFSRLTKKISFLEFLAPVVIIVIGTLILSGFFMRH